MRLRLSAIVLTKNEAPNIIRCLKSVEWCDEIIVLDDYSTDRTVDLIKSMKSSKISIIPHSLGNDFSKSRNYGLARATGEWVLFIDADEKVSPVLSFEISTAIRQDKYNGFFIPRRDVMWHRELKHGESGNIKLLRLAKRRGGEWQGVVHERWNVKGETSTLKNPILHYPHQTITEFLREINYYSDLRAKELYDRGERVSAISVIAYSSAKFLQNFLLKRGFLDGTSGLIHAVFMSLHSFLVRGKLWQLCSR